MITEKNITSITANSTSIAIAAIRASNHCLDKKILMYK